MVKIPTKLSEGILSTQTTANKITDIASFTRNSVAIQRAGQKLETIAEEFKQFRLLQRRVGIIKRFQKPRRSFLATRIFLRSQLLIFRLLNKRLDKDTLEP